MLHTQSVRTRYIFAGNDWKKTEIKVRVAVRLSFQNTGTPLEFYIVCISSSGTPPGTPGISKAASRIYPSTLSQDPERSSLRFTYQKKYLHESMNRWAAAISRLSGLNPSSRVQRRRPVCLSARSCCNTTATCSNVTGLPSSSHTSHRPAPPSQSFSHASPPSDQASWLQSCDLWIICGYLSSCCRADKYPYHIARRRMFEHTGGEGFRVSVHVERQECPSPPSRLQRRDRRQDVVSRAYSCRLIITDFHFCNCTLITLRVC